VNATRGPAVFFDAGCGPCRFFARVTEALSRSGVATHPLDGPEADLALDGMPLDSRFASFHLVEGGRTLSGADAMPAWVGLVGGPTWRRVAEQVTPVRGLLRSIYLRLWEYRRSHGCVAGTPRTD